MDFIDVLVQGYQDHYKNKIEFEIMENNLLKELSDQNKKESEVKEYA